MGKYKKTMILTSIMIVLPIIIGVLLWEQLPDKIATHFSFDGTPNGWSDKGFAVFGMPLFLLVCQWIAFFATMQDPKQKNMSEKLFRLVLWIVPVISWILPVSCYGYELGYETSNANLAFGLLGIMFLVIGNYLPKCRQNYTMGIKLPWTLDDEENWNHTHRMAGFLWVICGFLMLANVFLNWGWMVVVAIVVSGVVPTIYSYLYYKKHGKKEE